MLHNRAAKRLVFVVLTTALAITAGCSQKEAAAPEENKPIPVAYQEVKKENISANTVITGKVTPSSEVLIMPKLSAKVANVPVDVGSKVKKGDLLVKLDTSDLEISLASAINGLQNAKLAQTQTQLNYNDTKANYDRMVQLYQSGAISKQQLDQAELAYNLAKQNLKAPTIASAQNQIDTIRNQLSNGIITSPIDGEVATRSIDPGEMAGPSQTVMSVVNIDKVFIEGNVAESDISLVKEGQKVSVAVDAAGGSFEGTVKIVSPVADAQTKGYKVKVEVVNTDHKLKPGMFAEIRLVTSDKKDVIVIPKEALINRGADKAVYVVNNNVAEERIVETGVESDEKVEIIKGLNINDKYVIEGQQSLFDKAKVTAEPVKTK